MADIPKVGDTTPPVTPPPEAGVAKAAAGLGNPAAAAGNNAALKAGELPPNPAAQAAIPPFAIDGLNTPPGAPQAPGNQRPEAPPPPVAPRTDAPPPQGTPSTDAPPPPGTPPKPGQLPDMGKPTEITKQPGTDPGTTVVKEKLPGGWESTSTVFGQEKDPDQVDLQKKDDKGNVIESYHMKKDWTNGNTEIDHTKDGKTSIEITNQKGEVVGQGVSDGNNSVISQPRADGKIETDFEDKAGGTSGQRVDDPKTGTFKQTTYFGNAVMQTGGGNGQPEAGSLKIDGQDPIPVQKKDGKFQRVGGDPTTSALPPNNGDSNSNGQYQPPEITPVPVAPGAAQRIVDDSQGDPARERIAQPPKPDVTPQPPKPDVTLHPHAEVQPPAPPVKPKSEAQNASDKQYAELQALWQELQNQIAAPVKR